MNPTDKNFSNHLAAPHHLARHNPESPGQGEAQALAAQMERWLKPEKDETR